MNFVVTTSLSERYNGYYKVIIIIFVTTGIASKSLKEPINNKKEKQLTQKTQRTKKGLT